MSRQRKQASIDVGHLSFEQLEAHALDEAQHIEQRLACVRRMADFLCNQRSQVFNALYKISIDEKCNPEIRTRAAAMFLQNSTPFAFRVPSLPPS